MRIALDAMGSDGAPFPEVRGAIEASAEGGAEIILVGDESKLRETLELYPNQGRVTLVHASEVITMNDSPVSGVRQKKDSSLLVALRLVKNGDAQGIVSAGNTGAVMVAARTVLGPIKGVARSAICQLLPSTKNHVLLIDMGANVDCTARHLCDFAEMGMLYSQRVLGVKQPRVGLINIGQEQLKGNELARQVHRSLSASGHINFVGNIEPMGIFKGECDVAVCDGFVGNLVLKTGEAAAYFMRSVLRRELDATLVSRLGAFLSLGAFRRLKKFIDPNEYTGAPLLGVNGTVIIIHGSSRPQGVSNAIRGACRAIETELNDHIRRGIEKLRTTEAGLNNHNNRPA